MWKLRFEVYRSKKDRRWYWRGRAQNGRIVADGAHGYRTGAIALDALFSFLSYISAENWIGPAQSEYLETEPRSRVSRARKRA